MSQDAPNPAADLEASLGSMADLLAGERSPDRFDVRSLFLPLGALVLEGDLSGLAPTLERLVAAIELQREAWQGAVDEELLLATDEFCSSVDPRYLALPNYDMTYTLTSREYLACRIQAAEHLGFQLSPILEQRVAAADSALDPFL